MLHERNVQPSYTLKNTVSSHLDYSQLDDICRFYCNICILCYYLAHHRKQRRHQQATYSNNASIRSRLAQTLNLKVKDRQNIIRKSINYVFV